MGETESTIIKQSKNTKTPLPEKILNKPQLLVGLDIFLEAFYELNSDRVNGMSVGSIPFTAIQAYANEYDFVGDMREDLFYFVRAIDRAILKAMNEKNKRDGKKPTRSRKTTR